MKLHSLIGWSLLALLGWSAENGSVPSKKERDRAAILEMAGSYTVAFHFKETVSFQAGYELKPAYDSSATEIVVVVEDSPDKIVLQHVLKTRKGIIKHWRQDWEFENRRLLEFHGANRWKNRELTPEEAQGSWTQRVFQVDDSPRYEAVGRWNHQGNLSQWESTLTQRPLPRREYTQRDDYNILVAKNRQALTLTGWVHEQDNSKLRRLEDGDHIIAREFGLNRYDRIAPEKCAEARDWWEKHRHFWADVRAVWNQLAQTQAEIHLHKEIDEKPLYRYLFDLDATQGDGPYQSREYRPRIEKIIDRFLMREAVVEKAQKTMGYSP